MKEGYQGIYEGLTVLVTGHTGFKGSWLSLWLQELGAKVVGLSLEPTAPSHFEASRIGEGMVSLIGDVRDFSVVNEVIQKYRPAAIFHLAAQSLVLASYQSPKETFDVNAGGTVNILEAVRHCPSVRAVVVITTDKCYENQEWIWGYRENDPLGGADPYSASKCMAEHVVRSYRASFFQREDAAMIASARAGNVIGGGDFSANRIVPDAMKALMENRTIVVRNPTSVRPWLNVLDPLHGYLLLGSHLLSRGRQYAEAWNFGPMETRGVDVQTLVEKAIDLWGTGEWVHQGNPQAKAEKGYTYAEMGLLRLNWDKAAHRLGWRPFYSWEKALEETVDWFLAFNKGSVQMKEVSLSHLHAFVDELVEV